MRTSGTLRHAAEIAENFAHELIELGFVDHRIFLRC